MPTQTTMIQDAFNALAQDRQLDIIYHGAPLRLNDLQKRYFLAQGKVRAYEERYQTSLAELEARGLPDDAAYEMHEAYIMWHHWAAVVIETNNDIERLQPLVEQGLPIRKLTYAGD